MQEENRKEILTKGLVQKELTSIYVKNMFLRIGVAIPSALLVFLYFSIFREEGARSEQFAQVGVSLFNIVCIVFVIVVGVCCFYLLHSIYKFASYLFLVRKGKFDIVVDKLVYSEKDGGHKFNVTEYEHDYQPDHRIPYVFLYPKLAMQTNKGAHYLFRLQFAKHENFYIPEGKLYRWSDKYRMEHWAVYRWAEVGDEFYVVTIKNKPLYVYNTKHFELQE